VVKRLTVLLSIREDLGLNLSPETGYPDWGVSWFSSVLPGKFRQSTFKLGHDRLLSNSLFTYRPFIRRYIVWITEKASLNKLQNKKYTRFLFCIRTAQRAAILGAAVFHFPHFRERGTRKQSKWGDKLTGLEEVFEKFSCACARALKRESTLIHTLKLCWGNPEYLPENFLQVHVLCWDFFRPLSCKIHHKHYIEWVSGNQTAIRLH
jgi:hypothetical protein